jgi:hypothetical protein
MRSYFLALVLSLSVLSSYAAASSAGTCPNFPNGKCPIRVPVEAKISPPKIAKTMNAAAAAPTCRTIAKPAPKRPCRAIASKAVRVVGKAAKAAGRATCHVVRR